MEELAEFICPRCKKQLLWVIDKALVRCNTCFKTIQYKDLKSPNKCEISYSEETEQLKLF